MKQLTLEELKEMSGQPVWCPELKSYGIVKCEGVIWKDNPFLCGVQYDSEYGTAVNFEYDIQKRGLTCYNVADEKEEIEAEFVMSLGSFKTIWKCPKCGRKFDLKHEKEGLIQKADIDVNYCSGCGAKFNWEDGD